MNSMKYHDFQMDEGNLPQPKKRELAESILAVSFKAGEEERNMTKKIKTFLCAAKIIKASKELGFLSAEESSNFFANFQQSLGAATQKLTDGSNESILHVSEMLKILCEVHPDNAITLFHKEIERTVAAAANTIFPLEDKSHPAKFITSIFFEAMKTGDEGENFVARNLVSFLAIGNGMKTFRSFPDQEIRTIINILKRVHHQKKFGGEFFLEKHNSAE